MQKKEKENVMAIYKPVGQSPLDAINFVKEKNLKLKREKIGYAGRLDPLAEGVVLLVKGESLKNFKDYLRLDKEYEAKILFGFTTDTYDILGIAQKGERKKIDKKEIEKIFKKMEGEFSFSIPPFSSYRVKKKPLFWWAREGRLCEIEIPQKEAKIYSIKVLQSEFITEKRLKEKILEKLIKVKGDFRQNRIIENWEKILDERKQNKYLVISLKISCSSGCYIRSIANIAGESMGTGGTLFHLKRTRVGDYGIKDCIKS